MTRSVILAEGLRKVVPTAAGELVILDGIDLEINEGESVAITGASGSGKTTLLGILAGLDTASEGVVRLMDAELSSLDEEARALVRGQCVGFVFQSFQLLGSLTALENVMLPVELRGDELAENQAVELLKKVGLADRLDHYPRQLSGGEQQMLAISRALLARPTIMMLDEPSLGLSPILVKQLFELIKEINNEGISILLVEQNTHMALQYADRGYVLELGNIVASGTPKDLLADEKLAKAYLGGD